MIISGPFVAKFASKIVYVRILNVKYHAYSLRLSGGAVCCLGFDHRLRIFIFDSYLNILIIICFELSKSCIFAS